jgi:hypothetical protein
MADTMTSRNIDLASCDTLYICTDTRICIGLYAFVRRVDLKCFQVKKVNQIIPAKCEINGWRHDYISQISMQ